MKRTQICTTLSSFYDIPRFEASFSKYPREDEISFRRKRVNELRCRGYTNGEIAGKINCSISTVEKDLHEIRNLEKKWFEEESITDFCQSLHNSIILCDIALEHLQILCSECDDLGSKIIIFKQISDFEERKLSLYSHTKAVREYMKNCEVIKSGDIFEHGIQTN
jgi:IS30 family transposase